MPNPLFKHFYRPIEGFGLYVLRHCQHYCPGFGRISQYPHRVHQGRHQLFRAVNPVKETRDTAERIINGYVQRTRILQLLEHRIRVAGSELVRRQQQYRHPVSGGQRRASHHIQGTRTNRSSNRKRLQAVLGFSESRGRMDCALLVTRHVVFHYSPIGGGIEFVLQQRLTDATHVAVSENPESSGNQTVLFAVTLGILVD